MDDELKIIIKAMLDENTESSLNKQLKSLRLDYLPLNVKLNSGINNPISQAQKIAIKINETISKNLNKNLDLPKINPFKDLDKSLKNSLIVPFQIDIKNPEKLQDEMKRIVSDFTNSKGKLIDYKVKTTTDFDEKENKQIELLSGATLKYKNELDEIISKELKWQQIGKKTNENGEEQGVIGFAEAYSFYGQNIEKVILNQEKFKLSTQKLENKLSEYKKTLKTYK